MALFPGQPGMRSPLEDSWLGADILPSDQSITPGWGPTPANPTPRAEGMSSFDRALQSPYAAMFAQGMQNLMAGRIGQQMGADPLKAYQDAVTRQALLRQRETEARQAQQQREIAAKQAERRLDLMETGQNIDLLKFLNPKDSAKLEGVKLYMQALGLDPNDPTAIQDPRIQEYLAKSGGIDINVNTQPTIGEMAGADSKAAQDAFRDNLNALPALLTLGGTYNPEFLTSQGQLMQSITGFKDRIGGNLTAEEKQKLSDFTQFQGRVKRYFNNYRKMITGTAASPSEMEDIEKSIFNMEQGPTAFKAALEGMQEDMAREIRGAIYLQAMGKATMGTPEMAAELNRRGASNFDSAEIKDQVGDYIAQTLGFDSDNLTKEQMRAVVDRLEQLGFNVYE